MKYMGSKARIAKYILPIIQEYIDKNNINKYIEPFCGGCNIIDKIKCNVKIANDINLYLIELFKHLQNGEKLLPSVSRELYSEIRSNIKSYESWIVGNVGFLASYNGRFFDGGFAQAGYEGDRLRDYYREAVDNILAQIPNLKNVIFTNKNYADIATSDSLIYCDPPYANSKQYKNSKNFNYDAFWEWCRKMSKNNIVLISEMSAPNDFEVIWEQDVLRSIKSTDKSRAVEKLFIYKG